MRLDRLTLEDFRSYHRAELRPAPGLTVVAGPNAAGKTNLLEAIFVAVAGRSPRAAGDQELVRHEAPFARIQLDLTDASAHGGSPGATRIELVLPGPGVAEVRKRLLVNRVPRRPGALADVARVVLFRPEEMLLLVGAPSERRRFLDTILAQRHRAVARDLVQLARILAQRNALLRGIRNAEATLGELDFWDEQLVEVGSRVLHARLRLVHELGDLVGPLHARVAPPGEGMDEVRLEYVDSLKRHGSTDGALGGTNAGNGAGGAVVADGVPSVEELVGAFRRRLGDVRQKEIWNGMSLVGPQRDDLRVVLAEREVGAHASRGQQRTIILALKLAETELVSTADTGKPIVLLDDVFSELDPDRTGRLLDLLLERGQVIVTTADVESLPVAHRRRVPIWHVGDGRLTDAPRVA